MTIAGLKKWIEGDIEGNLHADAIGYILHNLYGTLVSTWLAVGTYNHVFTDNNTILKPSLAITAKDGGAQQHVFNNGMVESLEISAKPDDFVKFKAAFKASTAATSSATPSYSATEYDFIGRDIIVKIADTSAALAGAVATKCKSVAVTIKQGLVADHILGSYTPNEIFNTTKEIEIKITKNFLDSTFVDMSTSNTAKYMQIQIIGEAVLGGAQNPTLTILLNKAMVTAWSRANGGKRFDHGGYHL